MASQFNISEFKSTLNRHKGLASPAHYLVEITRPVWHRSDPNDIVQDLRLLCSSAALPGLSFATSEIRHYGHGFTEKRPYAPIFADAEMTFLSTADGVIHKFFHDWLSNISYFSLDSGISGGSTGITPFAIKYPEHYQTTITITSYNRMGGKVMSVKLLDAFPIEIKDIVHGWDALNGFIQIPIKFTYRTWTSSPAPTSTQDSYNVYNDDLINTLMNSPAGTGTAKEINNRYSVIKNYVENTSLTLF